jgi:outer membrane receptor protein involved in Fe transport
MRRNSYILLLLILINLQYVVPQKLSGQNLTGFIYELEPTGKKVALPGVNVFWMGTTKGTFTDESGKFKLSRISGSNPQLVVSLLGYNRDTINVPGNKNRLEIIMEPGMKDLSEVQITGRKDNTYISKLNARSTTVITTGELQRAACCNLAESFETNASVDVSYSDAVTGARQIQLLGLSGIYSQVMTENVPLLRGLATPYGLNYIPGSWMESIQIAKGTSSVVQGYESITGQINVEYKKPETSEKLFLNLFANSNLRMETNADAAVKINDRLSSSLLLHAADSRQKFDRNDDGFMDAPKLTTISGLNRWDYIIPGKWISRLGIKYLYEDRSGGQMDFEKSSFTFDTNGISTDQKKYGIGVKTNRLEAFWKNGLLFHNEKESSIGLIVSGINHQQDGFYGLNKYHGHEQNLNSNLIYTVHLSGEEHKLTTGASYFIDDYSESYQQMMLTYRYQLLPDSITPTDNDLFTLVNDSLIEYNLDRSEWAAGIFAEYSFDIKDKFSIIAGIRGDYNSRFGYYFTPRLHAKVNVTPGLTIRGSVGKGYRSPNLLAENNAAFISQRTFHFATDLGNEEAWNYGLNLAWDFKLFNHKSEFSIDAYRTSFVRQIIADQDSLPADLFFYNLDGQSFANVLQAQVIFAPFHRMSVTAAFRVNDVRVTEGGELKSKAMVNAYKGLLSISYATKFDRWKFDLTGQLNGPARLPDTEKMPEKLRRPENSPVWFNLLGQITRKFKNFDIYLGGENLTNFRQMDPIVEYWKPYHTHFDASMAWGPVLGISVYAGLRLTIK